MAKSTALYETGRLIWLKGKNREGYKQRFSHVEFLFVGIKPEQFFSNSQKSKLLFYSDFVEPD